MVATVRIAVGYAEIGEASSYIAYRQTDRHDRLRHLHLVYMSPPHPHPHTPNFPTHPHTDTPIPTTEPTDRGLRRTSTMMFTHLPTFPPTHIPTYPHSHLPTFPPTHIPTYPHSHLPTFPPPRLVPDRSSSFPVHIALFCSFCGHCSCLSGLASRSSFVYILKYECKINKTMRSYTVPVLPQGRQADNERMNKNW